MKTRGRVKAVLAYVVVGIVELVFAVTAKPIASGAKTVNVYSQLVLTPKAISFGKVIAKSAYFMIENTGDAPLAIDSVSLGPSNAFSILTAPTNGDIVDPKAVALVLLSFQPPAPGNYVATLTVSTNASRGEAVQSVALRGTGPNASVYSTPTGIQSATPMPTPSNNPVISFINPGSAIVGSGDLLLNVTGQNFTSTSTVNWNGKPTHTTFLSTTELTASIPAADLSAIGTRFVTVSVPESETSAPATFLVGTEGGPEYAELMIDRQANDLIYDPLRQVIYLSVPGAGSKGAISVLDLATGKIKKSKATGGDPDALAMSDDAMFLYAGVDGVPSVQRFVLPTLVGDLNVKLGRDPFYGPYYALDLQVAPQQPHTIAVARGVMDVSTHSLGGVVIFDDNLPRPALAQSSNYSLDSLAWGATAQTLYAENNENTGFDFYIMSVNPEGVALESDYPAAFSGFNARIHFDFTTGLVYSDTGNVVDPTNGYPAGRFPTNGPMVPDSTTNKAFFLNGTNLPATLESYNLTQFWYMNSMAIPDVMTKPLRMIRWGSNGIAFTTQGGPTYLIAGSFVH